MSAHRCRIRKRHMQLHWTAVCLATLLTGVVAAGCSGSSEATPATTTLFRYPDVETPSAQEAALVRNGAVHTRRAPIRTTMQLDAGRSVLISSVSMGDGDRRGSWLDVRVRTANKTRDNLRNPNMCIVCAGSTTLGGWLTGSTPRPRSNLALGGFNSGTMRLVLPGDTRLGAPVPRCETPAVIRVIAHPAGPDEEASAIDFAIPDRLVDQLNANHVIGRSTTSPPTTD